MHNFARRARPARTGIAAPTFVQLLSLIERNFITQKGDKLHEIMELEGRERYGSTSIDGSNRPLRKVGN